MGLLRNRIVRTGVLALVPALGPPAASGRPAPPESPRIPGLIADLASDDFARRDAASKALVEAGETALPALREALKTDNPEVQARARAAIRDIEASFARPQEVLDRLHGAGAFVDGETLALRDALRPVEQAGLRVLYSGNVDPAGPVTLSKHGQTALELIDHLAEAGSLGFQIAPGGVRVLPRADLDAIHRDLQRKLDRRKLTLQTEQRPCADILASVVAQLDAPVVFSPAAPPGLRPDRKVTLQARDLSARTLLRLALQVDGLQIETRYGVVVLSASRP